MIATVQIAGSLLILAAFIGTSLGRLDQHSYPYLVANAVGSGVLTATAVLHHEWGFLLLEGVWAVVSVWSIGRRAAVRH